MRCRTAVKKPAAQNFCARWLFESTVGTSASTSPSPTSAACWSTCEPHPGNLTTATSRSPQTPPIMSAFGGVQPVLKHWLQSPLSSFSSHDLYPQISCCNAIEDSPFPRTAAAPSCFLQQSAQLPQDLLMVLTLALHHAAINQLSFPQ